jgi:hypothetical protein
LPYGTIPSPGVEVDKRAINDKIIRLENRVQSRLGGTGFKRSMVLNSKSFP